jgi:hypothetical protein
MARTVRSVFAEHFFHGAEDDYFIWNRYPRFIDEMETQTTHDGSAYNVGWGHYLADNEEKVDVYFQVLLTKATDETSKTESLDKSSDNSELPF